MCTVSYIPKGNNNFILTSNRDEAVGRTTYVPDFYDVNGVKMLYPKDAIAGGTWIGLSEKSRLICLLNGGFENHIRVDHYKMSRGIVVKELLGATNMDVAIRNFDYSGIEPFTIVAVDWSGTLKATELVWDGKEAHIKELSDAPMIWSSSTLYTEAMKEKRRKWFAAFSETSNLEVSDMYDFHSKAGEGDKHVDVCMDRGLLKTVSITQVEKIGEDCTMIYNDLQKEEVHITEFEMITV